MSDIDDMAQRLRAAILADLRELGTTEAIALAEQLRDDLDVHLHALREAKAAERLEAQATS